MDKLTKNSLLDGQAVKVENLAGLWEALQEWGKTIHVRKIYSSDIIFLSTSGAEAYMNPGMPDPVIVYESSLVNEINIKGGNRQPMNFPGSALTEELVQETKNGTHLFAMIDGEIMAISPIAYTTLFQRAKLGGDAFSEPSALRDALLAEKFFKKGTMVNVVYREIDGAKKIFAFCGTHFEAEGRNVISDLLTKLKSSALGEPDLVSATLGQEFTDIHVKFPAAAEEWKATYGVVAVPGLWISTSDVGAASLTVTGEIYVAGSGSVLTDTVSIMHTKKSMSDTSALISKIEKSIFKDFRDLPETLQKLMAIPLDPMGRGYRAININIARELYLSVFDGFKAKLKSEKMTRKLINELCAELGDGSYTLYDIAAQLIDVPERIATSFRKTLDRQLLIDYKKALAQAPYTLLENATKATATKTEDEPLLLPA